jgi:hydroxymethylpyrimidine/phosphomethylpyrimidine kinase
VNPAVALTIAGSDSGGGAGIQADLKTFAAFGLFGTSAITAVTAQNTVAVLGVVTLDPQFVIAQIDAVTSDLAPAAVKTGMLATAATVAAVAVQASRGALPNLVVDPVLVSSSGHALMGEGGVAAYRQLLFPHAVVATPNLREAALLTGRSVADLATVEVMVEAAEELRSLGAETVVVKGGHFAAASMAGLAASPAGSVEMGSPDVVAGPAGTVVLPAARVVTRNDHGTGSSLSAAIAANQALGATPLRAITEAKAFVHRALTGSAGWRLGSGRGPIDHFGWSSGSRAGTPTVGPP